MPTIPFNDRYQSVNPASSTDDITIDFPIASTADLKVLVDGTETTDFTVTANFTDGIATGAKLNIITPDVPNPVVEVIGNRDPARTQFTVSSGFNLVSKINAEIAQRTLEIQEVRRDVGRAMRVAFGESVPEIPNAATRADKYFGWDGAGDPEMRDVAASEVTFSNTASGLSATDVQAALDELEGLTGASTAAEVTYDNATSGLAATDVQAAIDEVWDGADALTKVDKGGDTMTGALTLPGDPTADLEAAPKQYVDSVATSGVSDGDKGDIVVSGGGTVWSVDVDVIDITNLSHETAGDLFYFDASGIPQLLPIGSASQVLTVVSGVPAWAAAGGVSDGDKGDITVSGGGTTWEIDAGVVGATELASAAVETAKIADDAVTYAKIQDVSATNRFLGRITAGAGNVEELTGAQATSLLSAFTSSLKGVAPASGGGTTNFLRADGAWATPSGGGALDVQEFTGSGTWTKPAGATRVLVMLWGGGGSGGGADSANEAGGGGGGGAYVEAWFDAADLGSSETVTIGAGGAGVAADTDGNAGGNSTFGSHATAYAGGGGAEDSTDGGGGGGGGGVLGAGNSATAIDGGIGGRPFGGDPDVNAPSADSSFGGGAGGDGGSNSGGDPGGYSAHGGGGGGGGARASTDPGGAGGNSVKGGGGGAGGSDVAAGGSSASGGTSIMGGNGGASGAAGAQPGGGGGGGNADGGSSGAGGDGQCIVLSFS